MDPALNGASSSPSEDDEWDADGFEIPSLHTGRPVAPNRKERSQSDETYRPSYQREILYLDDDKVGSHSHYKQTVVGVITYQILPPDTQFVEIPLVAVDRAW